MSTTKRAAVYCRISRDAEDTGLGVARQEADCRALVERHGWTLVEPPYLDNDLSASSAAKKPRPAYQAMLAAARAGEIDVIVAYSNSRLTRRLRELLDLIDLHNETGVAIHTVVSGSDDLSTADGIMVAQIKGSVDEAEARRIGERISRKFLEKAQKGSKGQGTRAFGWSEDKTALHPVEAPLVRAAVQDVIDGVSVREVARRWNDAGVTTVRGGAWTHDNVRAVLKNPRLAGWRVHRRAAVAEAARKAGRRPIWSDFVARDEGGEMVRGQFEPMVEQEQFEGLLSVLEGRRPKERRGSQKYLLTGITRCATCGARMHGTKTKTGYAYSCDQEGLPHSVTLAGEQTDALLRGLVEARLSEVDLAAEPVPVAEWEGEARLRAIPGQIRELMDAFNQGVLSGSIVFPQVQALEGEQGDLERARPRVEPKPSVADADDFAGLDVERQRAVVESLVEAVVVKAAARRGQPWTPDRLEVVWR